MAKASRNEPEWLPKTPRPMPSSWSGHASRTRSSLRPISHFETAARNLSRGICGEVGPRRRRESELERSYGPAMEAVVADIRRREGRTGRAEPGSRAWEPSLGAEPGSRAWEPSLGAEPGSRA